MKRVIGVDFDNTLVSYDDAMKRAAVERGLVAAGATSHKEALRDEIRRLPGGEREWQKLQAVVYGPRIGEARLIEGVTDFFRQCREMGCHLYILSHKTEFANADRGGANLRRAALAWMVDHGFFEDDGLGLCQQNVYFEASRLEKLQRIQTLGCTHFVDDLEETFLEPSFPVGVMKILYAPGQARQLPAEVKVARTWKEIAEHVFRSGG